MSTGASVVKNGVMTESYYYALHRWVERQMGKPQTCWECGDDSKSCYNWANTSGEYLKDIRDWRRLCVPCHHREKNPGCCKRGHKMDDANTYLRPNGAYKDCRTCRKSGHAISNPKRIR